MRTINQINGRVASNQTISFYKELGLQYEKYNSTNYRNRYFKFKLRDDASSSLTMAGNFIYSAAEIEFTRIIKDNGNVYRYDRDNRREFFELDFSGYILQFQVRISQSINGVYLSVDTNFNPLKNHNNKHAFKIRSNETFANLDIRKYFERAILSKFLFAPGLFRNIQIMRNCSNQEAIQFYKKYCKLSVENRSEIDALKAWKQLFKRRLNIELCDNIRERAMPAIYNSTKRQKTRKKLFLYPNPLELSDMYCSEFDTDGHELEFLDSFYSDYPKNAMFI
jgi:hypothetical protein